MDLDNYIRHIPGFPKEGILFHDIMPLLQDAEALQVCGGPAGGVRARAGRSTWSWAPRRGASSSAPRWPTPLGVGFAAARKPGKLPWKVNRCEYDLEYGTDALEMHADAIKPGQRVLIHDDLLATGGTAKAKIQLVEEAGGVVAGLAFIIELTDLHGRDRLQGYDVFSLLDYPVYGASPGRGALQLGSEPSSLTI